MMDQPSIRELVEAVRSFLETRAMPELNGHSAFHARVAANALGIVARQLELGDASAAAETERLQALLGRSGTPEELNRALCAAIREGNIDLELPALTEHLEFSVRDKVAIDQPNYAGLKIAKARG